MAEKITPEEAANVAAAEAAAAVAAAQAEADAARDEREEYLFDLANQIASSQVATQVVAPVAGVAEDVAKEAKKLPLIGDIAEKADEGYEFLRRFGMRKTDEAHTAHIGGKRDSVGTAGERMEKTMRTVLRPCHMPGQQFRVYVYARGA